MFDAFLLLVAGGSQLVLAYMGVRVSTRPIIDPRKIEIGFLVVGVVGFGSLIWSGLRSNDVQLDNTTILQEMKTTIDVKLQPRPPIIRPYAISVPVPVPVSCVPGNLEPEPVYVDTQQALKAAPELADFMKLMAAGRIQRDAWLMQVRPVLQACRDMGRTPKSATPSPQSPQDTGSDRQP
jgi:hypothetical protein